MERQSRNHVTHNLNKSIGIPANSTGSASGEFVTKTFDYDGGQRVTVYVPPGPPHSILHYILPANIPGDVIRHLFE